MLWGSLVPVDHIAKDAARLGALYTELLAFLADNPLVLDTVLFPAYPNTVVLAIDFSWDADRTSAQRLLNTISDHFGDQFSSLSLTW